MYRSDLVALVPWGTPIVWTASVDVCSSTAQNSSRGVQSNPRAEVEATLVLCAGMALFEACQAASETACHSAGVQAIDPIPVSDHLHTPGALVAAVVAEVSVADVAAVVVAVVAGTVGVEYQTMPVERC